MPPPQSEVYNAQSHKPTENRRHVKDSQSCCFEAHLCSTSWQSEETSPLAFLMSFSFLHFLFSLIIIFHELLQLKSCDLYDMLTSIVNIVQAKGYKER